MNLNGMVAWPRVLFNQTVTRHTVYTFLNIMWKNGKEKPSLVSKQK
jgi:hypothetical protein